MTQNQWKVFSTFRDEFRQMCNDWSLLNSILKPYQIMAASSDTPPYIVDNPVVYNTDLDKITENDTIRLIVIGDNPGKNEQLNINRRYLCGQSGKIADGFFKKNPDFLIDFRKNVIILNKTPVHTAKTKHIKTLIKSGNKQIIDLITDSQIWMAEKTAKLHQDLLKNCENEFLEPQLWLVGYSELKEKGLFSQYRDSFKNSYKGQNEAWNTVKVFQHFSMNRFTADLNKFLKDNPNLYSVNSALQIIGDKHRSEIFL